MSDVIAGRIELVDPLARGATGSLWRAVDRRYDAVCAAKVMRQRDGADVLRFVREQSVGTAKGLGAHPHLLPPYTWVAEDDTIVLVMPLVRGGTVAGALREHGPLSASLTAYLLRQLLEALAAMHDSDWVHRDVKPANLLLHRTEDAAPHLLLADFGIALHESDVRLTATGRFHGTPGYMAPEVLEGHTTGTAQDVWAAATCAQQMLGIRRPDGAKGPSQGTDLGADLAPAPDPDPALDPAADLDLDADTLRNDPLSGPLHEVLAKMLHADPAQRPSAREALAQLPAPTGPLAQWCVAADGERVTVPDRIEALGPDCEAYGLREVGLDGPADLAGTAPGLHERITARSATQGRTAGPPVAATSPPAPAASPTEPATDPSTEAFVDQPTRVNPHSAASPAPPASPAEPWHPDGSHAAPGNRSAAGHSPSPCWRSPRCR